MEYSGATRKTVILLLACLLPLASSVPLSRSVSLRNLHQVPVVSGLEAPVQVLVAKMAEEGSLGSEMAARMVIEVNDYPGSGANNRHDPKSPGRP